MRAAVLTSFDGPDAITVTDVAEPAVGPEDVLLRVDAAAVGPWDVQTTTGMFAPIGGPTTFPQVVGSR